MCFYVYVLRSDKDNRFYFGDTNNLQRRLEAHNNGLVNSTKSKRPLRLVYWEGCLSQRDVIDREKYLKTAWGKRYMKKRLKNYLTG
jgi:putative endonuclease